MKIQSKTFYKILLFLLVLFPIYQDSPLSLYLGAAGYTILMPLSLILVVIYILLTKKFPYNPRLKELIKLGLYLAVISYVAIIVWLISGNSITVVSEFLPVKAFKVILQYFSYPSYIAMVIVATRKVGTRYIGKYAFITLIILTIICLIEKEQSPYAFEGLHFAGVFPYWRIRLLTTESSWTAVMIYVYTVLSYYWTCYRNKQTVKIITLVCALVLMLNTGSRTLMMTVAITALIYVIVAMKRLQKRTIIGLIVVIIAMTVFVQIILPNLSQSFAVDIEQYTSLATRLYTSALGLLIGICFPFGVGGAVYLGVFQNALSRYLNVFSKLPIRFNTLEIVDLATRSTDEALTVKSGILHYNMYWGILGTSYLMRNFLKVSSELRENRVQSVDILQSAFWCAVVMVTCACNFTFEFWLMYAFLLCLNETYTRKD